MLNFSKFHSSKKHKKAFKGSKYQLEIFKEIKEFINNSKIFKLEEITKTLQILFHLKNVR